MLMIFICALGLVFMAAAVLLQNDLSYIEPVISALFDRIQAGDAYKSARQNFDVAAISQLLDKGVKEWNESRDGRIARLPGGMYYLYHFRGYRPGVQA